MEVQCFFLAPTQFFERALRRYTWSDLPEGTPPCTNPCRHGHDNTVVIDAAVEIPGREYGCRDDNHPHDDPRWPVKCEFCDYQFKAGDEWQLVEEFLYRRSDNNALVTLRNAPVGAMYHAPWLEKHDDYWKGPDGHILMVKCPDGHTWNVDSRCSNCGLPQDNVHRCWVRHGEVPNITVDKLGVTCQAGGGSIKTPNYHGFLRNGRFVDG